MMGLQMGNGSRGRRGKPDDAHVERGESLMRSHRTTAVLVAGVVAVGVLGGGAATYAATSATESDPDAAATSETGGTMDGRSSGMGSFTDDAPFDAQFLDQMLVHHQGAIMSTQMMIADSDRPELRSLAQDIVTNQRAQREQMSTWRQRWYPNLAPTFGMGGSNGSMMSRSMMGMGGSNGSMMSGSMMGMGDDGANSGPDTDRMYLRMMIVHHQLAVDMAEQAQKRAVHPDLLALAATIATEQSSEIDRMRSYLADQSRSTPKSTSAVPERETER